MGNRLCLPGSFPPVFTDGLSDDERRNKLGSAVAEQFSKQKLVALAQEDSESILSAMQTHSDQTSKYLEAAKKAGETVRTLVQAGANSEQALKYQCELFVESLPDVLGENESFVAMMKDVIKTEAQRSTTTIVDKQH